MHCGRADGVGADTKIYIKIPIRGKPIVHIPPKFVRRLSFSGNPNINNATGFGELIENFPQLLELDVSFTGLKELPEAVANEKLGVLDIEGRVTSRISNCDYLKTKPQN